MPIYSGIYDGPARSYKRNSSGQPITSRKRYITIHNTSNDATAEGEAAYAKVRTDGTSSHYYCDNNSIVQSLNTDWCAGHVGSYEGNTYGISYEITGFNGWTRQTWLSDVAWELLAACIARDCAHFGIPVQLLTIEQMRAKTYAGFVTHDMCRIAWGGTTHTDPGPGFPMDHLLARVSAHLTGGSMQTEGQRNVGYMIQNGLVGVEEPTLHVPAEDGYPAITLTNPFAEVLRALVEGRDAKLPAFAAIPARTWTNGFAKRLTAIEAKLAALSIPPPAEIDYVKLAAALRPIVASECEAAVRKVLGAVDEPAPQG